MELIEISLAVAAILSFGIGALLYKSTGGDDDDL